MNKNFKLNKIQLTILYTDKLTEVDCDNKIFDIHL